ncbi:MAG: hypothetical protein GF317_24865 [Candidatus Lokiarchaeota archaeon]|nr:hypothetical protein [Candidatus Lokiarchaeota archaeon]
MTNTSLFDERLWEFEQTLLEYYLEKADFSAQSETLAKLFAYLSIYGELTQTQLKMLTNFSKSTVSTGLANLINIGYVKKEKIAHSREYRYFISYSGEESIDDVLGSMKKEINFLGKMISKLEKSNIPKDYNFTRLLNRLKEAVELYKLYQTILVSIEESEDKIASKLDLTSLKHYEHQIIKEDIYHINTEFNDELKAVEDEIIDFFRYESVYSILNEFSLIIVVYFMIRKVLTQKKLRILTGLSLGKVSEVLNHLLKVGHIQKVDKEKYTEIIPETFKRKILYSMTFIKNSFIKSGILSFNEILKWEAQFKKMETYLLSNRELLEKLNGYNKILKSIQNYLALLPTYRKVYNLLLKVGENK